MCRKSLGSVVVQVTDDAVVVKAVVYVTRSRPWPLGGQNDPSESTHQLRQKSRH